MIPPIASRIPLVRRPKAAGLPLADRIAHLTELTVEPTGASQHDLVARASGVLNYAALIASDVGMPDLAAQLCWRQHRAFAKAGSLTGDIAVMALMPLVNIARLLIREGDGEGAYDVLRRLYRAAQQRGTAEIRSHNVDLSALLGTEADHRKVCEELWVTMLIDGARALARIGRWTEAAETMAAHRGIGNRLLDGRQIMIMSLMERGLSQQARAAIESTAPTEPWENAIAALLRIYCRPATSPTPQPELELVLREALTLITPPDPATAAFQVRLGLVTLDLTRDRTGPCPALLQDAIVDVAILDAYAARDVLNHHLARSRLTSEQRQKLNDVLTASGLGAGKLSPTHMHVLTTAVDEADVALRRLL
ncbi:hypothetical protein OG884_12605 [Streptosporangium sp. NBC_01755]|uniref:hypothetical protein n=1 Tax=unclassified Streptosporangium TaxID=2632669 RepID=UPI002DD83644|nr:MULTISPECIES: hypothetical protein [unclassified Streptosporangium]WSA25913.1 hypothetical protein OIE13_34270 [Streptosporangium sp. NBC_01810]WSD02698.1 hypothetical protein OG884_12605 [Streptosporangium sp. NBC_01755]